MTRANAPSEEPGVELVEWVQRQIDVGRSDINIVRHLRQKGVDDASIRALGEVVGREFEPDEAYRFNRKPKPVTRARLIRYALWGSGIGVVFVGVRMALIPRERPYPPWAMLLLAAITGAVAGALFLLLEPLRYSRKNAGLAYSFIGTVTLMVFLLPTFFVSGIPFEWSFVPLYVGLCVLCGSFFGLYLRYMSESAGLWPQINTGEHRQSLDQASSFSFSSQVYGSSHWFSPIGPTVTVCLCLDLRS